MDELAEKRIYAARTGATELVVAAAPGLVSVAVSDGRAGEFGLARADAAADVAASADPAGEWRYRLAVATDEDVLLADTPELDGLEASAFGPAIAVTVHEGDVLAAGPDGRLAGHDGTGWTTISELPAEPTALDGDLVGTAEGVFRLVDGSLRPAGLAAVTGVARAAGIPLAATADGLYELGNGWLDVLDGEFRLVTGTGDGRAHAATADGLYSRSAGDWMPVELPTDDPVAAVAYGPRSYLFTAAGDLVVPAADGWERTPLGLEGIVAAAVLRPSPTENGFTTG